MDSNKISHILLSYENGQKDQMAKWINEYGEEFWYDLARYINQEGHEYYLQWFKFALITISYNALCPHPAQLKGKIA